MEINTATHQLIIERQGTDVTVRVGDIDNNHPAQRIYLHPTQAVIAATALKEHSNDARKMLYGRK